jgi:hypothetical protein
LWLKVPLANTRNLGGRYREHEGRTATFVVKAIAARLVVPSSVGGCLAPHLEVEDLQEPRARPELIRDRFDQRGSKPERRGVGWRTKARADVREHSAERRHEPHPHIGRFGVEGEPTVIGLDEHDARARPSHPSELCQRLARLGDVHEDALGAHGIEPVALEARARGRALDEFELCRGTLEARRAGSSIAALGSSPTSVPSRPTRSAISRSAIPVPQPTSRTVAPGSTPSSWCERIRGAVIAAAAASR